MKEMSVLLYLSFCLLMAATAFRQKCPENTRLYNYCHKWCSNLNDKPGCIVTRLGCYCDESKFFTNEGKCVEKWECPIEEIICPVREIYSFSNDCPKTCMNPEGAKECPEINVDRCECKKGFVRNRNGQCVSPAECDLDEIICEGELIPKCGNGKILTCEDYYYFSQIIDYDKPIEKCNPICMCPRDKYWDPETQSCVFRDYCEHIIGNRECQKRDPNSIYLACVPSVCSGDICSADCLSGCFCKNGKMASDKSLCPA